MRRGRRRGSRRRAGARNDDDDDTGAVLESGLRVRVAECVWAITGCRHGRSMQQER